MMPPSLWTFWYVLLFTHLQILAIGHWNTLPISSRKCCFDFQHSPTTLKSLELILNNSDLQFIKVSLNSTLFRNQYSIWIDYVSRPLDLLLRKGLTVFLAAECQVSLLNNNDKRKKKKILDVVLLIGMHGLSSVIKYWCFS